jgi:hypothetical protein
MVCPILHSSSNASDLRVKWPSRPRVMKRWACVACAIVRQEQKRRDQQCLSQQCVEATRELIVNPRTRSNRCSWPGIESLITRLAVHPHLGPDLQGLECIVQPIGIASTSDSGTSHDVRLPAKAIGRDLACALAELWCEQRLAKGP